MIKLLNILLLTWLGISVAPGRDLIAHGKSEYNIVVAQSATVPEQNAANELQDFLKAATGAELPFRTEANGLSIHIGQSPQSAQAFGIENWNVLKPDEILIKTVGDQIFLAGARPRGTLYAVYEFLETAVGIRFWTAKETHIPQLEKLELPRLDIRYAPPFEMRSAGYDLLAGNRMFALRMRNNGHGVILPPEWGDRLFILGGVHTFDQLIPAKKYLKEHPEYFSFRNGKRVGGQWSGQLCLSNPDVRELLTQKTLDRLAKNKTLYISVSQNDNKLYCECDKCKLFVETNGNQTDLLLDAVNHVADAVKKQHPETLVETLAYFHTRQAPETIRPRENVIIRYCTIEAKSFFPLNTPPNQKLYEDLAGWRKISPKLFIWNYVTDFSRYDNPHPNWKALAEDLRLFRDSGAISIYEQGSWSPNKPGSIADLADLRAYVISKLLWNPDLDTDRLIDEFLNGYYKSAAPEIRAYLNTLIQAVQTVPDAEKSTCYTGKTTPWLSNEALLQARRHMQRAKAVVNGDPKLSARVRAAAVSIEIATLERPDLFTASFMKQYPELRESSPKEFIDQTIATAVAAGSGTFSETGLTPETLKNRLYDLYHIEHHAGPRPAVVGNRKWLDFPIRQIAALDKKDARVSLLNDPISCTGKALMMLSNHSVWAIQIHNSPQGAFEIYAEFRAGGTSIPEKVIHWGVYHTESGKIYPQRQITADMIADDHYNVVKLGEAVLSKKTRIFFAPIKTQKSRELWFDRLILVPIPQKTEQAVNHSERP